MSQHFRSVRTKVEYELLRSSSFIHKSGGIGDAHHWFEFMGEFSVRVRATDQELMFIDDAGVNWWDAFVLIYDWAERHGIEPADNEFWNNPTWWMENGWTPGRWPLETDKK